jgi:hypothetical protein
MSWTDTTSEASLPEENVDISPSASDCASVVLNPGSNHPLSSPTPAYVSSFYDEQPRSYASDHVMRSSDSLGVVRHARLSASRHNVYSIPSREQRQSFKQQSHLKKHMFTTDFCDPFVSSAPTTLSPAFDCDQASSDTEATLTSVDPYLSTLFDARCNMAVNQYHETETPSRTSNKSGLTIKIPSLVDRLALRLLSSCNVMEHTEEDDDADSLDGYSASESTSDGDGDLKFSMQSPDRLSRRKVRHKVPHQAIKPYHRTRKLKQKEGRTRKLRSGRRYY